MNELMGKKSKKEKREEEVLLGLIELFLKSGKPIGSSTLQENGFQDLSSATIRNYFVELEKRGYLKQPHLSGGRIPTDKALRFFAETQSKQPEIDPKDEEKLQQLKVEETKNLSSYMQHAAEILSDMTSMATFLTSVRFEQDFVYDIKILSIDSTRLLAVLLTDFGQILTEILACETKLSSFALKRLESYMQWRLKGAKEREKPDLSGFEAQLAHELYTEIMVRYLVRYSNYSNEEIFRTGFSRLLAYPEFNDPVAISSALALFENNEKMHLLLDDCVKKGDLTFWIGSDLASYAVSTTGTAVIAIPYRINKVLVGAVGLLGPSRLPYRALFGTLQLFESYLSETLTKSLYKFKLAYRHPRSSRNEESAFTISRQDTYKLLEIKESK